ncbi:hypothetical protein D3C71_2128190 [compost metagenome]
MGQVLTESRESEVEASERIGRALPSWHTTDDEGEGDEAAPVAKPNAMSDDPIATADSAAS